MKIILMGLILIPIFSSNICATELTPEYLEGKWCFKSVSFGSEEKPENRNWVFEKGGKFLHQNSKHSNKIKYAGYWEIKDDKLQIKPVYLGGHKDVEIVSPDKFIFKWMGMAAIHVVRGSCN